MTARNEVKGVPAFTGTHLPANLLTGGTVVKTKRNIPGLLALHESLLNEGDSLTDGSLPLTPPVDLYETRDCYVLSAELPGVEGEDVHVEVRGSEITILGERKVDSYCCEESYHRLEGIRGRFHRTFSLPEVIDGNAGIKATLKDGVLKVELPKTSKSRSITIRPSRSGR